ncbi:MAG: ThiF family adenylyltransferase [Candidatus Nanohaloarchaea archaeon]
MYSRFRSLENYGEKEIQRLHESRVAVVGLGATGSVIAEHLARHGIELALIDRDYLEENDLYSSNLYGNEDVEKALPKAKAAAEKLSDFTEVDFNVASLSSENTGLMDESDLVMDGTDNLETRFLIDEYCCREGKPWIYTSALAGSGYSLFLDSECFSCMFEEVSAGSLGTCEIEGIMREVASAIASKSAMKAVRYLAGKEVEQKLETFRGEEFDLESDGCEVCREEKFPHLDSPRSGISVCGEQKFQLEIDDSGGVIERLKAEADSFSENDYLLKSKFKARSVTVFRSGRVIVEAEDRGHAEALLNEIAGV